MKDESFIIRISDDDRKKLEIIKEVYGISKAEAVRRGIQRMYRTALIEQKKKGKNHDVREQKERNYRKECRGQKDMPARP